MTQTTSHLNVRFDHSSSDHGLGVAKRRFLHLMQGVVIAWAGLLALVVLVAPAGTPTDQLLGIDELRPSSALAEAVSLADLPLLLRLVSVVGITSVLLSLSTLLWAVAREPHPTARKMRSDGRFSPSLGFAAKSLAISALVLGGSWLASVTLVERWVSNAAKEGYVFTLVLSPAPIGAMAFLFILSGVVAIMARKQTEGGDRDGVGKLFGGGGLAAIGRRRS